jgi:hypothetical protein
MIINNNDQKGSISNDEVHHISNEGSKILLQFLKI